MAISIHIMQHCRNMWLELSWTRHQYLPAHMQAPQHDSDADTAALSNCTQSMVYTKHGHTAGTDLELTLHGGCCSVPRVDHVGGPLLLCFTALCRLPGDLEEEDPAGPGVVLPKGLAGAHCHHRLTLTFKQQICSLKNSAWYIESGLLGLENEQ